METAEPIRELTRGWVFVVVVVHIGVESHSAQLCLLEGLVTHWTSDIVIIVKLLPFAAAHCEIWDFPRYCVISLNTEVHCTQAAARACNEHISKVLFSSVGWL